MTSPSRRVAIVTGGTGALGQAVSLRLLAEGGKAILEEVYQREISA